MQIFALLSALWEGFSGVLIEMDAKESEKTVNSTVLRNTPVQHTATLIGKRDRLELYYNRVNFQVRPTDNARRFQSESKTLTQVT